MKGVLSILALFAIMAAPVSAQNTETDEVSPTSGHHLVLEVGSGLLIAKEAEFTFQRYNLYFSPNVSFQDSKGRDRVIITPKINFSTISIDMIHPNNMLFDATLTLPWQVSLGVGAQYRHPVLNWLDIAVFAQFEFPPTGNEANITKFDVDESEKMVDFEIEDIRDDVHVTHHWQHYQLGIEVMAHPRFAKWWHPFIDLGYISTVGRLTVEFEPSAAQLLSSVNINPDRFYDTDLRSVYYAAGSNFDLTEDLSLRFATTIVFSGGDDWIVNSELGLRIPMDILNN